MTAISPDPKQEPVAVGAIGGSGSRVLARILRGAGVSIGANLNESEDNLDFTIRFRHRDIVSLSDDQFSIRLAEFEAISQATMQQVQRRRWGWKEPNSHVIIDRIFDYYPKMRYIHLLRDGRDMAFSRNCNQARLWGPIFLGRALSDPPSPRDMLAYFCAVHRRVSELAKQPGNRDRILFVNYEQLCGNPEDEIHRILNFIGMHAVLPIADLAALIHPSSGIGRHRAHDDSVFYRSDIQYLGSVDV
jgi:hypothetical protein